jgi:hypothetical protein
MHCIAGVSFYVLVFAFKAAPHKRMKVVIQLQRASQISDLAQG